MPQPTMLGNHFAARLFYKAPFFKFFVLMLWLWSLVLNFTTFSYIRYYFGCSMYDVITKKEVWRLFTRNFAFLDIKDLIVSSFMMNHILIFERRLGTHKFISYMVGKLIFTTILELLAISLCEILLKIEIPSLPMGPYGLIFPLLVDFYYDVPRVTFHHVFGIPVTGKSFVYLMTLNILSGSTSSIMSGVCAGVAGLLHRCNFLKIKDIIVIPKFISNLTAKTLGRIVVSSPPQNNNVMIGATLELQRQQLMDLMEQSTIAQQLSGRNSLPQQGQGYAETLINSSTHNVSNRGFLWPRRRANATDETPDQMVRTLVEMGFDRQSVLAALRSANNNLTLATSILLNER